jgi:hypothetical protein
MRGGCQGSTRADTKGTAVRGCKGRSASLRRVLQRTPRETCRGFDSGCECQRLQVDSLRGHRRWNSQTRCKCAGRVVQMRWKGCSNALEGLLTGEREDGHCVRHRQPPTGAAVVQRKAHLICTISVCEKHTDVCRLGATCSQHMSKGEGRNGRDKTTSVI